MDIQTGNITGQPRRRTDNQRWELIAVSPPNFDDDDDDPPPPPPPQPPAPPPPAPQPQPPPPPPPRPEIAEGLPEGEYALRFDNGYYAYFDDYWGIILHQTAQDYV
jgi:hypothetical protein